MSLHYRQFENIRQPQLLRFMRKRLEKQDKLLVYGEATCNICGYEFIETQEAEQDGSFTEPFPCPICQNTTVEYDWHEVCKLSEFISELSDGN